MRVVIHVELMTYWIASVHYLEMVFLPFLENLLYIEKVYSF